MDKTEENPPAAAPAPTTAAAPTPAHAPQATPAATPVANTPPAPPEQKKNNPWPWIVGGCLLIVLIIIGTMVALGWWGARKVKQGIEKYQPTIDKTQENFDRMNREAAEWEKKSEEFRNSVPNPEDFQEQFPSGPDGYSQ